MRHGLLVQIGHYKHVLYGLLRCCGLPSSLLPDQEATACRIKKKYGAHYQYSILVIMS